MGEKPAKKLTTYRRKRDPARTTEPFETRATKSSRRRLQAPMFVVQRHAARRLHYDLRLERDGVLETRRGVGSFISATRERARPPAEHQRRLKAFVTRMLADAAAAGFTAAEVIAEVDSHRAT